MLQIPLTAYYHYSKEQLMLALTPSSTTTLESAPHVIPEQQITLFKFYMDQAIQDGLTYGNELYRLAKEFRIDDWLEADRLGCELIGQGIPTVISVSKQRYSVWISLRNPLAATFAAS